MPPQPIEPLAIASCDLAAPNPQWERAGRAAIIV
jgi:hypothetical protein